MTYVNDIESISDLGAYFEALASLKDHVLIAIAVKDTPGINFDEECDGMLRGLGLASSLKDKSRSAFIGIVDRGKVLVDKVSRRDETLSDKRRIGDTSMSVVSSGYGGSNRASIVIDGLDYAVNLRGLNVVVYDIDSNELVDSVVFDTHLRTHPVRRRDLAASLQMNRIENLLARLERKEEKIQQMLEKAEKQRLEDDRKRHLDFSRLQMMLWHALPESGKDIEATKRAFFKSLPKATGALRKTQAANLVLLLEFDRIMKENSIEYWLSFGSLLGAARAGEFIPWDDDVDVCVRREDLPRIREAFEGNKSLKFDQFYWLHKAGKPNMDIRYKIRFRKASPLFVDVFPVDFSEHYSPDLVDKMRAIKLEMSAKARTFYRAKYPETYADTRRYLDAEFGPMFDEAQKKVLAMYGDQSKKNFVMFGMDNLPVAVTARAFFPTEWIFPLGEVELCGHTFPAPRETMRWLEKVYGDPWSLPEDMFTHQHFTIDRSRELVLDGILETYADLLEGFELPSGRRFDGDLSDELS